jgi:hypothetical protein
MGLTGKKRAHHRMERRMAAYVRYPWCYPISGSPNLLDSGFASPMNPTNRLGFLRIGSNRNDNYLTALKLSRLRPNLAEMEHHWSREWFPRLAAQK